MPGANAPIPRAPSLTEILVGYSKRLRRLEVNHRYPNAGTAIYGATFSASPADSWAPSFTDATASQRDEIGLTLSDAGVLIPNGWIAWATVQFTIYPAEPPPTGEAVLWVVGAGGNVGEFHTDVMANATEVAPQSLAATLPGPSGWNSDGALLVELGAVSTYMGTEFTPLSMQIAVVAIQLPVGGWPPGGVD